jgi:hypothetical protein
VPAGVDAEPLGLLSAWIGTAFAAKGNCGAKKPMAMAPEPQARSH